MLMLVPIHALRSFPLRVAVAVPGIVAIDEERGLFHRHAPRVVGGGFPIGSGVDIATRVLLHSSSPAELLVAKSIAIVLARHPVPRSADAAPEWPPARLGIPRIGGAPPEPHHRTVVVGSVRIVSGGGGVFVLAGEALHDEAGLVDAATAIRSDVAVVLSITGEVVSESRLGGIIVASSEVEVVGASRRRIDIEWVHSIHRPSLVLPPAHAATSDRVEVPPASGLRLCRPLAVRARGKDNLDRLLLHLPSISGSVSAAPSPAVVGNRGRAVLHARIYHYVKEYSEREYEEQRLLGHGGGDRTDAIAVAVPSRVVAVG